MCDAHEMYPMLALLGIGTKYPALTTLQAMCSLEHYQRASQIRDDVWVDEAAPPQKPTQLTASSTSSTTIRPTPKSHSIQSLSTKKKAKEAERPTMYDLGVSSTREFNASGVAIEDEELMQLFRFYDTDGKGWISRKEFKKTYASLENFGLPVSERELNELFTSRAQAHLKSGDDNDTLTYGEFCIIMLHRAAM